MKGGHTGDVMSCGLGIIHIQYPKQKLNTKSSTESEVVGAIDYVPQPIWAKLFLSDQAYILQETIVYQDD